MKPTIIALKGKANCGKTKTLTRVLAMLKNQRNAKIEEEKKLGDFDSFAIIIIGKVKVGITTEGDPGGLLEINIDIFIKAGCQVIICACRTRQSTRDVISKFEASLDVLLISQTDAESEPDQLLIQEKKAEEIVKTALQIIQKNQTENDQ